MLMADFIVDDLASTIRDILSSQDCIPTTADICKSNLERPSPEVLLSTLNHLQNRGVSH